MDSQISYEIMYVFGGLVVLLGLSRMIKYARRDSERKLENPLENMQVDSGNVQHLERDVNLSENYVILETIRQKRISALEKENKHLCSSVETMSKHSRDLSEYILKLENKTGLETIRDMSERIQKLEEENKQLSISAENVKQSNFPDRMVKLENEIGLGTFKDMLEKIKHQEDNIAKLEEKMEQLDSTAKKIKKRSRDLSGRVSKLEKAVGSKKGIDS